MRGQTGGLFQPRQSLPPGRKRAGTILRCHPGQIVAIRRHPRQHRAIALVRIEREQLPHQHRQRPAIHHNVMVGEHQAVLLASKPDQRKANERRTRQVEALGTLLRQDRGQALPTFGFIQ